MTYINHLIHQNEHSPKRQEMGTKSVPFHANVSKSHHLPNVQFYNSTTYPQIDNPQSVSDIVKPLFAKSVAELQDKSHISYGWLSHILRLEGEHEESQRMNISYILYAEWLNATCEDAASWKKHLKTHSAK
jgi:hypothetical protein